ncbi:zinc-ribbon domain-containing protein [Clostridium botulinum]|uniref:zinc-ribbon domain-containing protein n=1 Tax=Clostridium botulinum TaxID=1491 RepID=UPI003DA1DA46
MYKKCTLRDMKGLAKSRGGKCLSEKYINTDTKLIWQCAKGHIWPATPHAVKRGSWCPDCSKKRKHTIKEMQDLAKSKGGKCLSKEYVNTQTKLEWQCKNGHIWSMQPNVVIRGQWCPKCSIQRRADMQRLTITEMQNIAKTYGGKCLSLKYVNVDTKLKWQCNSGHIWLARPHDIKKGAWCPKCARIKFFNEEKCRYIFEKLLNKNFFSTRTILPNGLELDGYNEELNLAFEYNGEQHYNSEKMFHKSPKAFEKQKKRDEEKKELCKARSITLIEIPYTEAHKGDKSLINFIIKTLENSKIKIVNKLDDINTNNFYKYFSPLQELKQLANSKGGECLSTEYLDSNTKLKWKCRKGHIWNASPISVKNQGHWCPECVRNKKYTLEQMKHFAKERGGKCLSNKYINSRTKLKWECSKGHVWEATPHHIIIRKQWCPECSERRKLTIIDMYKLAEIKGGKCLSKKYEGMNKELQWKCSQDHTWWARPFNIKHNGNWCPECRKNEKS